MEKMVSRTWILVDKNKRGTHVQCEGLARALSLKPSIYYIDIPVPWRWFPGPLPIGSLSVCDVTPRPMAAPWPEIIITSGRRSAGHALAVKRTHCPNTVLIAEQDPGLARRKFDHIIAPRHDRLSGDNVISTTGALNVINAETLTHNARPFANIISPLSTPRTAVLIGGPTKGVAFSTAQAHDIAEQLMNNLEHTLLLSTSRRTPNTIINVFRSALQHRGGIQYYGQGPNPYYGFLNYADSIAVTSDSVSMMSEACTAGKPVYIIELPGSRAKFQRFVKDLYVNGLARPFDGNCKPFETSGLNETERVARILRGHF
jgi:mitochondrial fission protein ELM1